jgi:single-stranded DNA-specific DHH superfamily exonuclease
MVETVEKLHEHLHQKVRITFFDHHNQRKICKSGVTHINPLLEGKAAPSTTWVISEYLNTWNYLSALGAVGDKGSTALKNPSVLQLLRKEGLNADEAVKLTKLIDSNYILMDRNAVERAVKLILKNTPSDLLEMREWHRNLELIEREVENILSEIKEKVNFAEVEFKSRMNIISMVARKAVWERGYSGVVAINRDFHGHAQVYFRVASSPDLSDLIDRLKNLGFKAGGKREVVGLYCSKEKLELALNTIRNWLEVVK